jgi:hypothetical protein
MPSKLKCKFEPHKALWVTFTSFISNSPCMLHVLVRTGPRFKSSTGMQSSEPYNVLFRIEFDLDHLTEIRIYLWTWSRWSQNRSLPVTIEELSACQVSSDWVITWLQLEEWYHMLNLTCSEQSLAYCVLYYALTGWTNEVWNLSSPIFVI